MNLHVFSRCLLKGCVHLREVHRGFVAGADNPFLLLFYLTKWTQTVVI